MNARERIMGRIDAAAGKAGGAPARPVPLQPARGRVSGPEAMRLFADMAAGAAATVERSTLAELPAKIAAFLERGSWPANLKMADDPRLLALDWGAVAIATGEAADRDRVSLAPAFAAIAETGTVCMVSGPETPSLLNFLPECEIVVLAAADILGSYEELWSRLRTRFGNRWPRVVNLVTGPSRSADIEQTLLMGAHGPKTLHVVILEDGWEH